MLTRLIIIEGIGTMKEVREGTNRCKCVALGGQKGKEVKVLKKKDPKTENPKAAIRIRMTNINSSIASMPLFMLI